MANDKQKRKPRQKVDRSNETKAQKFVRLAEARMTKAVAALRNLTKLGGNNYERTAEQQKKIVALLETEVKAVETALVPHVPGAKADKKNKEPVIKL